jgi:hypothetical protein
MDKVIHLSSLTLSQPWSAPPRVWEGRYWNCISASVLGVVERGLGWIRLIACLAVPRRVVAAREMVSKVLCRCSVLVREVCVQAR